jgi:hypothetical protein
MADPMEGPARTRLVALVVLLAVAVPLTIVAATGSGGGDDEEEASLRVERSLDVSELISTWIRTSTSPSAPGASGRWWSSAWTGAVRW